MTIGDTVKIFPHGHCEQAELATVTLIGRTERSLALSFEEMPVFCRRILDDGGKVGIDRRDGKVVMLLYRESIGPWIELQGGGHYEIEERAAAPA